MGKMKDLFIEQRNNELNEDLDWQYHMQKEQNLHEQKPMQINEKGLGLYMINGYRVWAENYEKAVELAKLIDDKF